MASKQTLDKISKARMEPWGFETQLMAAWFARKVAAVMLQRRPNSVLAQLRHQCAVGKQVCGLVGCPVCDRYRRIAFAVEAHNLFYPLSKKSSKYDVYFVTIVPDDGLMPLKDLPKVDWMALRLRYSRWIKDALGPKVIALMGPDIDVHPRKLCCLHLHAFVAVPAGQITFRCFTEALVGAFNPRRHGAARPVLKKVVKARPKNFYRLATYILKSRFSVASKVHKHNGVFLGKREFRIRQFLQALSPRSRIVRIGKGVV